MESNDVYRQKSSIVYMHFYNTFYIIVKPVTDVSQTLTVYGSPGLS